MSTTEPVPGRPPGQYRVLATTAEEGGDALLTPDDLDVVRGVVAGGGLVVLPTDTVYGIGADAFNAGAVQQVLRAKGRGRDAPPPVLIGDAAVALALATDISEAARTLMAAHWPGPLTLVLPAQPSLHMDLGDTGGTIALRVPDCAVTRQVLAATGPLAVTSANLTGEPPATDAEAAIGVFGARVEAFVDDGPRTTSEPSTIIDLVTTATGRVLRRGALAVDTLRASVPDLADLSDLADPAG